MGFSEGGSSVRAEGEGGSGLPPCKKHKHVAIIFNDILSTINNCYIIGVCLYMYIEDGKADYYNQ